jgi:sodium-dependent dicarboxylate transporter 2/3/5
MTLTNEAASEQRKVAQAEARFDQMRRRLGLFLAPALFIVFLLLPLPGLSVQGHRLAAICITVITLWITEAIPLPATALLGPALAVLIGVAPAREVFAPFADPLIFVFIGTFILAQAIFAHRLNERIAYGVLSWKIIGARPVRLLLAYGGIAAFVSMWISNTASTAMLLPLGLSLLTFMESVANIRKTYATVFMLITAYGASMGGMATPVGTPPNLITIGMIERFLQVRISFVQWMMMALPVSVVLMAFVFIYLNRVGWAGVRSVPGADKIIADRKRDLGPWTRGEKNVAIAFLATIALWVIPGLTPLLFGPAHPITTRVVALVPESVGALIGALLLFVMPLSRSRRSTITWEDAAKIDWGTILLFGGGLALGELVLKTKLADAVGLGIVELLPVSSIVALTYAAALFGIVISETMSNTAATNIAIPIVISIAQAAGVNPIIPAMSASLAASMGMMLPVSTPPNAIVYASGRVPITKMARHGVLLDIVSVILIPLMMLVLVPLVMGG